jgi:hypothetical protein
VENNDGARYSKNPRFMIQLARRVGSGRPRASAPRGPGIG